MIRIPKKEIELLKKLTLDNFTEIEKLTKIELDTSTVEILRRYYKENTMNLEPDITNKLRSAGINDDDGKYILSNMRRLGIDIS